MLSLPLQAVEKKISGRHQTSRILCPMQENLQNNGRCCPLYMLPPPASTAFPHFMFLPAKMPTRARACVHMPCDRGAVGATPSFRPNHNAGALTRGGCAPKRGLTIRSLFAKASRARLPDFLPSAKMKASLCKLELQSSTPEVRTVPQSPVKAYQATKRGHSYGDQYAQRPERHANKESDCASSKTNGQHSKTKCQHSQYQRQ